LPALFFKIPQHKKPILLSSRIATNDTPST
jgi:hypothetical protein